MLVFHKNPIHSALALILTLFSTAAMYVLLSAGFIAVMQVLVYAGAIMVLFVYVIMMLNLQREELGIRRHAVTKIMGTVVIIAIGTKFIMAMSKLTLARAPLSDTFGSLENVGWRMFTDYFLPVEAVGVMLLAAVVGAVMLAKTKV